MPAGWAVATAEEDAEVLDFPVSGFTFTVPDFVESLSGSIYSIGDYGETNYKSGVICSYALYLSRTAEESAAISQMTDACSEFKDWPPAWLKSELDKMGWTARLEPMSNTAYFKRPDESITQKYALASDHDDRLGGDLSHIVVM